MPPAPLSTHPLIVAGDDYKAADGRALAWGPTATWPTLAGATLALVIGHDSPDIYGNTPLTWTAPATVVSANGEQTVSMDVTAVETGSLQPDTFDYTLTATLSNDDKVTLAAGLLTVLAPPTDVPLYPPAL